MVSRIDAPAKCELRSVIHFLQVEGCLTRNSCIGVVFGLASSGVFVHDNVRPHSAVATQQLLEQFEWGVSIRPEYGPDLAASDFYLFPELKNWLGGQSF
ncbi:hypothetical protein AVEN_245489-1 [Araneus ventricosus]|uniref:Tc1-like transposase DDE domain-containing protein n=1 Tax=Araneus ventricosus TaxID=182803 RepID=A0A4Y2D814_ARAVE|nr:hypothetical protein AVEN_245489-1 [Araneus ventricosus]